MVQKSPIKNEHYEAYREGRYEDIPADVLELLRAREEMVIAVDLLAHDDEA